MALRTKALIWLVPVLIFPIFTFFITGSVTDLILSSRGVAVEGVTVEEDINDRRIVYEYSFNGQIYRHEFKFVGEPRFEATVGEKRRIILDPRHPEIHRNSDPAENLRTNLLGTLFVFLGTSIFYIIAASNGFQSPFAKADLEAKERWRTRKYSRKR